ncbi:MAG: sulfur carrier protein ThiS [Deltaproteobacteria bacterium]|nr:sulfur carrier protein ThiS [Deltaproteobacteria bacterium]
MSTEKSLIQISINDAPFSFSRELPLQALLDEQQLSSVKGIAVAVNDHVIARQDWPSTIIRDRDQIIVITATQGG